MTHELLQRMITGIDTASVATGRGRVKALAEATGYSAGMVSRILSGKIEPADKFILALCAAFDINFSWVTDGEEPVLRKRYEGSNLSESEIEKIDREAFGIMSQERKDQERFIMGLVRRLPDEELQPVEDFVFDLVKKNK